MTDTNEGITLYSPQEPKKMRAMRIDDPLWNAAAEALKPFGMTVSGLARLAMDAVANDAHEVLMLLCEAAPEHGEVDGPNWEAYYAQRGPAGRLNDDPLTVGQAAG